MCEIYVGSHKYSIYIIVNNPQYFLCTVKPCKMGHGGVTWDKSDFYFEGYISENILDTFMHSFVKVSLEPCLSVPLLPFWVAHTERVKKHI